MRRLILGFVIVASFSLPLHAGAQPSSDADGDGLPDGWEIAFGLDPQSAAGANGAAGDPDADGTDNGDELAAGTHPRGLFVRRLAEGVDNAFFQWRLALANPEATDAHVLVAALQEDGTTVRLPLVVAARSRRTIVAADFGGLPHAFSVTVDSDVRVGVDRLMTWNGAGSHAESAIAAPARRWYLAEGATGGPFNLFYLLQNAGPVEATVTIRYLLPDGSPPLQRTYAVLPRSRHTIWVDTIPGLQDSDVSADISATADIVVERAMYLNGNVAFAAGHAAAAVPAPSLEWFLAEGATGPYFDEFILLANPAATASDVQIDYLLADGTVIPKAYTLAPASRRTIWLDREHPALANAVVSARLRSTNGVPFIAERTMWWSDGAWFEAHNSPGATSTGTRWLVAEGEVGGPARASTYLLLANTSPFVGQARVTLLFDGGGTATQTMDLAPNSRFSVDVESRFPAAANRRFGALVESLGADPAELVVEMALYGSPGDRAWELGACALATNLSSPLRTLTDTTVFRGQGTVTIPTARTHADAGTPTFSVTNSAPSLVTVTIDPATGALRVTPGSATGTATITVRARIAGRPDVVDTFQLRVMPGRAVSFATPVSLGTWLFPAFADFDGDGVPELFGTARTAQNTLVLRDLRAIGLGPIVDLFPDRQRDNRVADFTGDGRLDVITHTYAPHSLGPAVARLFVGQADGTFAELPSFTAHDIRGFGETILAADFDNDHDLDLYLPQYTHTLPSDHNRLLLNDGHGIFTDVSDAAGVAVRGWPAELRVEGTQAVDFDGDGDLDLFAASHFFFNEGVVDGVPRFVDRREALGLPLRFEEGFKFFDADNDGLLDVLHHHDDEGPQVWRFDGARFSLLPLQANVYRRGYGANVCDLNGDGFEDLILAPGDTMHTRIFVNTGQRTFIENPPTALDPAGGDVMACGDYDGDGRLDLGRRAAGSLQIVRNTTSHTGFSTVTLELVDADGARNQFGRVARVRPRQAPGVVYTRVVDGGSGFLTQGQYPLLIGTPYTGQFDVTVRFADAVRTFVVSNGQRVRLFADGTQQAY